MRRKQLGCAMQLQQDAERAQVRHFQPAIAARIDAAKRLQVHRDGDQVAVRWTARGRHENTYLGEGPTGRDVTQEGISILRLDGGVVVEVRSHPDSLGLLQQLGVLPTMSIVD